MFLPPILIPMSSGFGQVKIMKELILRIGMVKQKMVQLNNIWKDKGVPRELKIRILKCLIWPVVLYGSKAWVLRKDDENRIQAADVGGLP
jgi:hypothetical protein